MEKKSVEAVNLDLNDDARKYCKAKHPKYSNWIHPFEWKPYLQLVGLKQGTDKKN